MDGGPGNGPMEKCMRGNLKKENIMVWVFIIGPTQLNIMVNLMREKYRDWE
jgi:hypothetical protein